MFSLVSAVPGKPNWVILPETLQIFQVEPKEVAWREGRAGGFLPGETAVEHELFASLAPCFPASYPSVFAFAARPHCLYFPAG